MTRSLVRVKNKLFVHQRRDLMVNLAKYALPALRIEGNIVRKRRRISYSQVENDHRGCVSADDYKEEGKKGEAPPSNRHSPRSTHSHHDHDHDYDHHGHRRPHSGHDGLFLKSSGCFHHHRPTECRPYPCLCNNTSTNKHKGIWLRLGISYSHK